MLAPIRFGVVRFNVVDFEIFEILFWCAVNYSKNQKQWSPIVVTNETDNVRVAGPAGSRWARAEAMTRL